MLAVLSLLLDDCDLDIASFVFALGSVRSLRWVRQVAKLKRSDCLHSCVFCLVSVLVVRFGKAHLLLLLI